MEKITEYFNNNVISISKVNFSCKLLFLLTNLVYIYPIFKFGINFYTFLLLLIGIFSSLFHYYQCGDCMCKIKKFLWLDILFVNILGFIIFIKFSKSANAYWYIIFLIALGFFSVPTDASEYLYIASHGMWHLITGFLFMYLLSI